jgi:hypothetical protein
MAIRFSIQIFAAYLVGILWLAYLNRRRPTWRRAFLILVWPLSLLTYGGRQALLWGVL